MPRPIDVLKSFGKHICPECNEQFKYKHNLYIHLKKFHKINIYNKEYKDLNIESTGSSHG